MSDTVDFKRYKRRWGMLAIIAVLNAVNALFWLSFAPVAPTSARYYDVSTTWIDMMSIIFMIFYIPAGFVSSYVLDKHGLRRSVRFWRKTEKFLPEKYLTKCYFFLHEDYCWRSADGHWRLVPVFRRPLIGAAC